jgi:hypothetical protein
MTWYVVSIDAYGHAHLATAFDHRPAQAEYEDLAEMVGYYDGGCIEATTEAEAIRQALADFTPGAVA